MNQKEEFLINLKKNWYDEELVKINESNISNIEIDVDIGAECIDNEFIQTSEDIVHFYLAYNSINHQFWSHDSEGNFIRYQYEGNVGAMALGKGIFDYVNSRKGMSNSENITTEEFQKYFGHMPDAEKRIAILNQAFGQNGILLARVLLAEKDSGWTIINATEIANTLPLGYKDEALKKAQLVLHMISSALKTKGIFVQTDLTCFADYQIPRVLRHMGILEYNTQISNLVDNNQVIPAGSKEEHAIRAATILACEKIAEKIKTTPAELDYWLWSRRNTADKPFHLTYTTAY